MTREQFVIAHVVLANLLEQAQRDREEDERLKRRAHRNEWHLHFSDKAGE